MKKILVVEDDHRLSETVSSALSKEGYDCKAAFDGQMAIKLFNQVVFDLVILDINLPKINGFDLCKSFRQINTHVPLVVITAFGDIDSKMEAFNWGADDYLVKPIHIKELIAKVKVFLKRSETMQREVLEGFEEGNFRIDAAKKEVIREGKTIALTPKEYSLLAYLAKHKGRVVSKDELAAKVWEGSYGVTPNTIEVYINFLRNKIDKDFHSKAIHTKPGFGYFFSVEE